MVVLLLFLVKKYKFTAMTATPQASCVVADVSDHNEDVETHYGSPEQCSVKDLTDDDLSESFIKNDLVSHKISSNCLLSFIYYLSVTLCFFSFTHA